MNSFYKFLENKDKKVDDDFEIDFNKNKSMDESDELDLRKSLMGPNSEEHLDYVKRFLDKLNIKYEVHVISVLVSMSPIFTITMEHPNDGSKIEVMINKKMMSPIMKHIKGDVVNPKRMTDLMDLQNFLIKHWSDVINKKAFKSMNEKINFTEELFKSDLSIVPGEDVVEIISEFLDHLEIEHEKYVIDPYEITDFITNPYAEEGADPFFNNDNYGIKIGNDKRVEIIAGLDLIKPFMKFIESDDEWAEPEEMNSLNDLKEFLIQNLPSAINKKAFNTMNEGWFSKDKGEFELSSKDLKRDLMKLSKKNFEIYLKAFTKKFDLKFEEITLETGRGIFQYTPSRIYDVKYPISLYKISNPRNYFAIDIGRLRDRIIIDKRSEFVKTLITLRTIIPRGGGVAFDIKNSDFKHDINNIKDLMDFLVKNDYAGLLNLDNDMKSINEGWFSKKELSNEDLKRDLTQFRRNKFETYLDLFAKHFGLKFLRSKHKDNYYRHKFKMSNIMFFYKLMDIKTKRSLVIWKMSDTISVSTKEEFFDTLANLVSTRYGSNDAVLDIPDPFLTPVKSLKDIINFIVKSGIGDLLNTDRFTRSMNEDIVDRSKEGDMSFMQLPFEEIIETISKSLNKLGIEYEMLGKSKSMDDHKADIFQIIMDGYKKITLEVIQPYGNVDGCVELSYITFHYYEMNNALAEENRYMIIKRQGAIQNIGDMVSVLKDYPEIINKKVFKNINESPANYQGMQIEVSDINDKLPYDKFLMIDNLRHFLIYPGRKIPTFNGKHPHDVMGFTLVGSTIIIRNKENGSLIILRQEKDGKSHPTKFSMMYLSSEESESTFSPNENNDSEEEVKTYKDVLSYIFKYWGITDTMKSMNESLESESFGSLDDNLIKITKDGKKSVNLDRIGDILTPMLKVNVFLQYGVIHFENFDNKETIKLLKIPVSVIADKLEGKVVELYMYRCIGPYDCKSEIVNTYRDILKFLVKYWKLDIFHKEFIDEIVIATMHDINEVKSFNKIKGFVDKALDTHKGGESYFDAIDSVIKDPNNIDVIEDVFSNIKKDHGEDFNIILTGGFGDRIKHLIGKGALKIKGNIIQFGGSLRTKFGNKANIVYQKHDPSEQEFILFDDSYYSGATKGNIEDFLSGINSRIIRTYVIYDGSREQQKDMKYIYRYRDHHTGTPVSPEKLIDIVNNNKGIPKDVFYNKISSGEIKTPDQLSAAIKQYDKSIKSLNRIEELSVLKESVDMNKSFNDMGHYGWFIFVRNSLRNLTKISDIKINCKEGDTSIRIRDNQYLILIKKLWNDDSYRYNGYYAMVYEHEGRISNDYTIYQGNKVETIEVDSLKDIMEVLSKYKMFDMYNLIKDI